MISDTLLRLLVCIAVSHRGLTDEEWQFMRKLEIIVDLLNEKESTIERLERKLELKKD